MYLLCGSFCFTIYLWPGALKVYKNNLFLFSRGGGVVVGGFFILNIIQKPFFLIQQVKGRRYLRSDPRNISSPEVPFHVYQKELILILISMKLSCSNHVQTLRAQIYMMQSLFHRIQPAQAHVHGFTCQYWHVQTNTCSPFVTNINFFLLSLHILRELGYGPKWCCSVYITPGWGLIKEFSYEV